MSALGHVYIMCMCMHACLCCMKVCMCVPGMSLVSLSYVYIACIFIRSMYISSVHIVDICTFLHFCTLCVQMYTVWNIVWSIFVPTPVHLCVCACVSMNVNGVHRAHGILCTVCVHCVSTSVHFVHRGCMGVFTCAWVVMGVWSQGARA